MGLDKFFKKVSKEPAFDGLANLAKEAMAFSAEIDETKVTPGVLTEIIWKQTQARTPSDIQEILEFWLAAEGLDVNDVDYFRTNGTLSTFVHGGFLFNSLIQPDPIFEYSNMLVLVCYVYEPSEFYPELLAEFNKINHPGSFHLRASEQSRTGFHVQYMHHIYGEPKSLQHAIGTAMNLSVSLAEQLAPTWQSNFGGNLIPAERLQSY